jgi:hypothetical protein
MSDNWAFWAFVGKGKSEEPLFRLARMVWTPGARDAVKKAGQSPYEFLYRHMDGDWGELDAQDVSENNYALKHGLRLLSSYTTKAGDKLWVITEADRSVTTLLLAEEY